MSAAPAAPATVSEILEHRLATGEASGGLVFLASLAGHVSFFLLLVLLSGPRIPRPAPFTALPVRVVSPSSLPKAGASAPPPAAVPTAPPAPLPLPTKGRNVIQKVNQERVVPPTEKAMPRPGKKPKEPETVAGKKWAVDLPPVDLPPPAASGNGEAKGGALNFGAAVSGMDADFPFAYYVEQLQALIGANWLRPEAPDGTACVVTFRIQRSGQITDVRLESSSGIPFYDRAATRALYSANPLPPLPPEFRGERLGVHLKFQ